MPSKTKSKKRLNAEEIVQRAMPKWKPVQRFSTGAEERPYSDASSPSLGVLQKNLKSNPINPKRLAHLQDAVKSREVQIRPTRAQQKVKGHLIVMAPANEKDSRVGAKVQVEEGGKRTGSQG